MDFQVLEKHILYLVKRKKKGVAQFSLEEMISNKNGNIEIKIERIFELYGSINTFPKTDGSSQSGPDKFEQKIINYYMRTSKGIKATAGYFGLSSSYVGSIIHKYKKKKGIR